MRMDTCVFFGFLWTNFRLKPLLRTLLPCDIISTGSLTSKDRFSGKTQFGFIVKVRIKFRFKFGQESISNG